MSKYSIRLQILSIAGPLLLAGCLSDSGEDTAAPNNPPPAGNSAPVISGSPVTAVTVGESYSFQPASSDADGDTLSFTIQNKPQWAAFDTSSGILSGSPAQGSVGTYSDIGISVSDGNNTASLPLFSIEVTDVGSGTFSVTLSWTPPTENDDDSPLTDLAAYRLYYGLSDGNYSDQVYIDNAGVSSYTVQNLSANTYFFAIKAVNNQGAESEFSDSVSWTTP